MLLPVEVNPLYRRLCRRPNALREGAARWIALITIADAGRSLALHWWLQGGYSLTQSAGTAAN